MQNNFIIAISGLHYAVLVCAGSVYKELSVILRVSYVYPTYILRSSLGLDTTKNVITEKGRISKK